MLAEVTNLQDEPTALGLAAGLGDWTLSDTARHDYAGLFRHDSDDFAAQLDALRSFQRRHRTAAARMKLVEATLARLIDERDHLPALPIAHLCTWVRGFGLPRQPAH